MELDQVAFKDQSFQIRVAQHDVKIVDALDHRTHLDAMIARGMEILADAVFQVHRLADVDDFPCALHQIAAGTGRKLCNFQLQYIVQGVHLLLGCRPNPLGDTVPEPPLRFAQFRAAFCNQVRALPAKKRGAELNLPLRATRV